MFTVTAKCWREGCYAPAPFTPRSDRCNLSCSFLYIITIHSSFENTTLITLLRFQKNMQICLKMSIFCNIYLVDKINN